jgi:protein TonB
MTSLSLPTVRRRFLAMLWLSAALHAAMIGLARLPPPASVPLPPELEVQLAQPAAPAQAPVPLPEPRPAPKPPSPLLPAPQASSKPQAVVQPLPQPATPAAMPAPQAVPAPAQAVPAATAGREAPGPELSIPLVADSRYYTAKELDVQPSALRRPEPIYPPQAEEQGVAGRVVIRLHLEHDGSVSKTEVASVSPGGVFGELFRKATLDSLRAVRFRPAQRSGQPVRAVVEIPVVFEPER